MKLKHSIKAILLFSLLLLCNAVQAQSTDTTKHELNFKGTVSATNNGFSLVPTFSLGKPAIITSFSVSGKRRFSFEPQFFYSLKVNGSGRTFCNSTYRKSCGTT